MTSRGDRARLVYDVVRRLERGESIRQIARAKGIARKTVRKIARENARRRSEGDSSLERAGVKPRAPRPSKLDPYIETIDGVAGVAKQEHRDTPGRRTASDPWMQQGAVLFRIQHFFG